MDATRDGEPLRKSLSPEPLFFSLKSLSPSLSLFGRFSTEAQALFLSAFLIFSFLFSRKKRQKGGQKLGGVKSRLK
jgi:hypothetical protein